MIKFDGKDYNKIALHGGGNPMFGHYVGLFEKLEWFELESKHLNVPFITSSAGSMAILYFVYKLKSECDVKNVVNEVFSKVMEEIENVLSNLDQKSIISVDYLDSLISKDFECMYDMTFKDLNELIPEFEWTVCCSKQYDFKLQTYGTHTPDVVIWKACLASMALPVIFPAIEIDGCFNCDGDLSNWVEEMNILDDSSILHIGPKLNFVNLGGINLSTEITLIDEMLKIVSISLLKMLRKKEAFHGVNRTELVSGMDKHFFSNEYIESGRLMAEKFVLK
jgi:hypothetical protein